MQRVNDILLGPLERPALAWFCRHMPSWVTPDGLTLIGIAGGTMTLAGYWLSNMAPAFLWMACAGLFINWFGDSLDGSLARFRHIERPKYGFFVDHMTDAFVTSLVCVGVGLTAAVRMDSALCVLVAYLLMSILTHITSHVTGVFRISYGKVGPTEIRAILIVATIVCYLVPDPRLNLGRMQVRVYDLLALCVAAGIALSCVAAAWKTSRELALSDRPSGSS